MIMKAEINCNKSRSCIAFGKLSNVLRKKEIPMCLRSELYSQYLLPVLTRDNNYQEMIKTACERLMLNVRQAYRKRISCKHKKKQKNNCITWCSGNNCQIEWNGFGHVVHSTDNVWRRVYGGMVCSLNQKQQKGPTVTCWEDDIVRVTEKNWFREA